MDKEAILYDSLNQISINAQCINKKKRNESIEFF